MAFASTAFMYFVKFSLMDTRYMFQLLKAHNDPMFSQSSDYARQRISLVYIKYCLYLPRQLTTQHNTKQQETSLGNGGEQTSRCLPASL